MAIHTEAATLSIEVIGEYLIASELCLDFRKENGGCLGYPAALLLFCILDAIGRYLALDKHNSIPKREPFFVLNHPSVGLELTREQVKQLEKWYRNSLSHNAALPPGTCLTTEDGPPFDLVNGEPVKIRLVPFLRLLQGAWARLDKNVVRPSRVLDGLKMPTVGFTPPAAGATVNAASGYLLPEQTNVRKV